VGFLSGTIATSASGRCGMKQRGELEGSVSATKRWLIRLRRK